MTKRDTMTYDLVKGQGNKVVYRGRTSRSLEDRETEHISEGKNFDRIVPTSRRMSEKGARQREEQSLERYRRNHGGQNPKYNKTDTG